METTYCNYDVDMRVFSVTYLLHPTETSNSSPDRMEFLVGVVCKACRYRPSADDANSPFVVKSDRFFQTADLLVPLGTTSLALMHHRANKEH